MNAKPQRAAIRRPASLTRTREDIDVAIPVTAIPVTAEPDPPAPAPQPAPVPVPAPQPAAAKPPVVRPAPRPRQKPTAVQAGTTLERVVAAGVSARRESRSWTAYTPRLPAAIWQALEARRLEDATRTGNFGLAVAHYLQVAFDSLPRGGGAIDPQKAASAGLRWLQAAEQPSQLVPTGSRCRIETKAELQMLALRLKTLQPRVELWIIQAACVQGLLDALADDSAGS